MTLTSPSFFLLILSTFVLYFLLQKTGCQRYVLLAASFVLLIFMSGSVYPAAAVLLLAAVSFFLGLRIDKAQKEKQKDKARRLMRLGLVLDLGLLLYFKFFRFTWTMLQQAAAKGGVVLTDLIAPIGLSYFTLSIAAYLIDIAHKKHEAETDFLDFLLFVTYFPSLIQGPINLFRKTAPQLKEAHAFDPERARSGIARMIWGYFKKMVIADRIGIFVIAVLKDENAVGWTLFSAMVLYSFQVYADFSGGIDVIMGISHILGIDLNENFDAPFMACSVPEFWKRWHKTLGEWMEKYVYYPLVLSKPVMKLSKKLENKYLRSVLAATLASFVVFILVGIWHGTGWNYVVYGCYQAVFVAGAALMGHKQKKLRAALHIDDKALWWKLFTGLRTFVILVFGRYLSRAGSLTQAISLYKRTFSAWNPAIFTDGTLLSYGLDKAGLLLTAVLILFLLFTEVLTRRGFAWQETYRRSSFALRTALCFAGLFLILVFGVYGPGYDASAFIYQSF